MALVWSQKPSKVEDATLVDRVAAMTYMGRPPFEPALLEMLGELSQRILHDPQVRNVPQYVALAYWLRPAALKRLSANLTKGDMPGRQRVPRGVALHLPPMNVDTLFVYSWALSVLAGNANVVWLAERLSTETSWLVSTAAEVVAANGESERQLFCNYAYGGETEQAIAALMDLRMIWGGDVKVEAVSRVPIRPDGLSIGFPDRQSLAIIDAAAYGAASESDRDALVDNFFNDTYWFDQMGCGSPRLLVWLGEPNINAADLYGRLRLVIDRRGYEVDTGTAIGKFWLANDLLAEGTASAYTHFGNALDVSRVVDPENALANVHGGGFLSEWVVESIDSVPPIVTRKVQTITHFGIKPSDLKRLAQAIGSRGGYRIVPIGEALNFEPIWDGVDLYSHMTRQIVVRG